MEMKLTHQSTSLAEFRKALEADDCKPWVTNLSMVPPILGILTANIAYCIILLEYVINSQVNAHVVQLESAGISAVKCYS